jgi:hypothetical protein
LDSETEAREESMVTTTTTTTTTTTKKTLDVFEGAGIAALVHAGESKNWFAGHFGATMIAGARLLREPDLNGSAGLALQEKLDEMRTTHRDWFSPLDDPGEVVVGIEPVLSVLRKSADTLRMSGHPTIYMSAALWVLAHHRELATDRVVAALIQLHDAARLDDPARHYGFDDYFVEIENEPAWVSDGASESLAGLRGAFNAMDHLLPDGPIDGRRYFLNGEKIHLVTHAHAVLTLEELGHVDLVVLANRAQRSLLRLTTASHRLEAPVIAPATHTPLDQEFWQSDVRDPAHLIKLAEAVIAGVPRLPERERQAAQVRLARMWTLLGIA